MKQILYIIFLFILFSGNAVSFSENLYPINDEKGGGYINKYGKIVVEQKYNSVFKFSENFAIAIDKNLKYGVIDKKGNTVVEFKYDELKNLNENFVIYKENEKWGYINILKNIKSKAQYDDIRQFQEGLASIKINNKWGFINNKGKIIIEPKYLETANFSQGLAAVSNSQYKTDGYINKKGKIVISFKDNLISPKEFHEGLAPVLFKDDKACSYINKRGKIVIDNKKIHPINMYCGNFSEGLNVFYIDQNQREITTGYVNKKGKIKYQITFSIPEIYSEGEFSAFDDFSSNMAQITIDYKTGYIDKKFKLKIPIIFDFARNFDNDLVYVKFENKEGYINKDGFWVWNKEREGM